jgi:hypothetical protein
MTRCPSDLELEALLRAPAAGGGHVLACPRCAARVAEMRRLGEEFEREVFPPTVEAVVAGATRSRAPRLLARLAPLAAAAAAAALFLLLRPGGPAGDRLAVKGPPLTLVAYRAAPGGARAVTDGETVPAAAGLRFEVRPARACNLWIVSADAAGHVSRIYPPAGKEGVKVQAGGPVVVPGGAVLDGRAGPERFFAVCGCGDEPIGYPDVERAAAAVGPGEARVRAARTLPHLPGDALQATILIEKKP